MGQGPFIFITCCSLNKYNRFKRKSSLYIYQLIPQAPSGLRWTVKTVGYNVYLFMPRKCLLSKNSVMDTVMSVCQTLVSHDSS